MQLNSGAIREVMLERSQDEPLQETEPQPLVIVDGKNMPYSIIAEINPDDIQAVAILKGAGAVKRYGEEAKNGAICIVTKKK